jgi:hypothetical protein
MIKIKSYQLDNLFLTRDIISKYINQFWSEVYKGKLLNEKHLMLMCKVEFSETELGYRTLGHLRRVNFEDKNEFIDYIVERLSILNDSYTTLSISKIIFTYIIQEGQASNTKALLENLEAKELTSHRFNNMNLPITMNPYEYGTIRSKINMELFTRYIVKSVSNKIYEIDISLDNLTNTVTLLGASQLKWIDSVISENCFKREIGKSTIYFMDGEIVLRKVILPAKPFKKLNVEKHLKTNFVTMDIETIQRGNQLIPYLICAYNGKEYISAYSDSLLNQKVLFNNFIKNLLTFFKNSNRLMVYAHNLSSFDGIFLLKHLINYGKVKPLFFNGRIMCIQVILNIEGYEGKTIIFKDSYLLLTYSLRKLCEAFGVTHTKSYFPFKLNNINYSGVLPKFEYWTGITPEIYVNLQKQFKHRIWDFHNEALKYCKLDCLSLYQVLSIFNKNFYNKFQINIHSSLTAPSLAMRLFKTHFMLEDTVYQIHGEVEEAIRLSYTGGAVDVYIPHNKVGAYSMSHQRRKLYYYDVNSLYPAVMANQPMPIGAPIFFEGDIRTIEPNAYGFFYCKITSPTYLEHPILQRRIKTSEGVRTIAGLGSWEGWINSTEMDNAIKFGYTFQIFKGYQFKTGVIFGNYVNTMFNLRVEYPKGHPMNETAKLMNNSLYGKFGMRSEFNRVDIFAIHNEQDKVALKELLNVWGTTVKDFVFLEDQLIVVRDSRLDLSIKPSQEDEVIDSYHGTETNIAIASAVTAEARVHMSVFKNNSDFHLYYSDTDSVVTDRMLPSIMVGKTLGLLKLEYVIDKAVFLAPKVYGLITSDGDEIIKIKGITPDAIKKEDLHISDLESLLYQDSIREFNQEKWFKNIKTGTITVSDIAYTLKVTSNKRQAIYIDGMYEKTIPFQYNEIQNNKN